MNTVAARGEQLREVRGPSALAGGGRRFFDLLLLMSVTEFKRTYFGTVLGYLWSLVRPLMLFAVLLFVFTQVLRVGSGVDNYPVLLLLGIVLYSFFQETSTNSVTAVVAQEGIVRKTQFPRLVIPLAVVLTGIFNLTLNLLVVTVFILAWGVDPTWTWLLFPVALILFFAFAAAISMMLSALFVRFRDTMIIWSVMVTVLFYATPILYPIEIVPEQYRSLLMINPLAPIFEQVRVWVIDPSAPTAVDAAGGVLGLLPAFAIFVGTCVLGILIFSRAAPRIAEEL
ncbi:MAG TPA: ABC transporter permease [Solirubrobacterales bacterium]